MGFVAWFGRRYIPKESPCRHNNAQTLAHSRQLSMSCDIACGLLEHSSVRCKMIILPISICIAYYVVGGTEHGSICIPTLGLASAGTSFEESRNQGTKLNFLFLSQLKFLTKAWIRLIFIILVGSESHWYKWDFIRTLIMLFYKNTFNGIVHRAYW